MVPRRIALVAPFPPLQGGMAQLASLIGAGLEADGFAVTRVDKQAGRRASLLLPGLYLRLLRAALQSDVVHVVSSSGNALWAKDLPAVALARLLGRRAVLNFVGGQAEEWASSATRGQRLPFRLADRVVVPTEQFRAVVGRLEPRARSEVIPNCVAVEQFLPVRPTPARGPVMLAAKALEAYAGFDRLIEALALVRKDVPDAELWICGDGPERGALEALVMATNAGGVSFLGAVRHEDMPGLMARAAVFVSATRYESFGIALVEAMAAGIPVVAFSVGGIPEVVRDGVDGFLAPYGRVVELASRMVDVLRRPGLRRTMGDEARSGASRFGWATVGSSWRSLYGSMWTAAR